MLIALSGLGCHHKSCDVAYAPPSYSCFGGGCYANVYPSAYVADELFGLLHELLQRLLQRLLWRRLLRLLRWRLQGPSRVRPVLQVV